jgi:NADH:ubiquinone oxidoreductase subunit 6 (subunit J)
MTSLFLAAETSSADGATGAVILLVLFAIGLFTWIVPGIIASCRKHYNAGAIWAVTILLGWTFIGWVIAFVWAFTNPPPNQAITINNASR